MKYEVSGTIELNWSVIVEADSEEEAAEIGAGLAFDGNGHDAPVGEAEVNDIRKH